MLEKRSLSYIDGPIVIPPDDQFLVDNVQKICVCDTGNIVLLKVPSFIIVRDMDIIFKLISQHISETYNMYS